ncbi:MAG: hypothetical protein R2759_00120 [Bacteroidales bacterium]
MIKLVEKILLRPVVDEQVIIWIYIDRYENVITNIEGLFKEIGKGRK